MVLDSDRFEADVLGSAEPVLVDFYRPGCRPCKLLAPVIDRLSRSGYQVCKLNVEDRPDLTLRYRVGAVPTLVIFRGGEEVARLEGLQPEGALRDALHRARAA